MSPPLKTSATGYIVTKETAKQIILNVPNHYIVLAGIDKDNNIYVLDPANAANNGAYNDTNFINKFK